MQPDRGSRGDRKQGYHDTSCPPRHAYAALYAALREAERIDALVHLGTHGTLEWLPGKALALSQACFPEALLGPMPVVYPFIVNNPGEAVQAKRRIAALTIGHLTPPLCEAGLHGPMAELEGADRGICRGRRRRPPAHSAARSRDPGARLALGAGARIAALRASDAPRAAIAKLDAQLCDIKDLAIRDSLHVFGRAPSEAARAALAQATLRGLGARSPPGTPRASRLCYPPARDNERAGLLAALDGAPRRAGSGGRADARAPRRAAERAAT